MKTLGTWTEAIVESNSTNKDNKFYRNGFCDAWEYMPLPSGYRTTYTQEEITLYDEGWENARKLKFQKISNNEWKDDGISEGANATFDKIIFQMDNLYNEVSEPTIYAESISHATVTEIKNLIKQAEDFCATKQIYSRQLGTIRTYGEMRIELIERKYGSAKG